MLLLVGVIGVLIAMVLPLGGLAWALQEKTAFQEERLPYPEAET